MNNENTNSRRHYAPEEKVKILRQQFATPLKILDAIEEAAGKGDLIRIKDKIVAPRKWLKEQV